MAARYYLLSAGGRGLAAVYVAIAAAGFYYACFEITWRLLAGFRFAQWTPWMPLGASYSADMQLAGIINYARLMICRSYSRFVRYGCCNGITVARRWMALCCRYAGALIGDGAGRRF